MLELLSPAGSMESVEAAVQNGADAVYFGYGAFNARRNAKNFTPEQAAQAVSYCHLRGVKVHLTLNTLLTDRELPLAAQLAAQASDMGVDALIVQDLGVVRMLKQSAPDLPLHASTQMSVHSLDGVKRCADSGFSAGGAQPGAEPGPDRVHLRPLPRGDRDLRPRRLVYVLLRPVLLLRRDRRPQRQPGPVRPALPSEIRLGRQGQRLSPVPEGCLYGCSTCGS